MFSSCKATSQASSAVVCRDNWFSMVFWWEMWNGDREVRNPGRKREKISAAVHLTEIP